MIKKLTAILFLLPVGCLAQKNNNFIRIDSNISEAMLIRKAACVTPTSRQLRWQELEVTGFFHFGINTFTNKEWGSGKEDSTLFNPTQLDAAQWVRVAKNAGIKQVILTAKHHDGFCLWPSQYTTYSVKHTPWKNGGGDLVKEVSDACHEAGIGFGIYLSPWDRHFPEYGNSEKYNAYFMNQLSELLTGYGRIDEVWLDGANGEGADGKKPVYNFEAWYGLIRKLQPSAVVAVMGPDVRWVGTESGAGRLTEWSVLPVDANLQEKIAAGSQKDLSFVPQADLAKEDLGSRAALRSAKGLIWYPSETDVSIRPGWFYHAAEDEKVKSPAELFRIYLNSVGRNSVLLLNVPPDKRGLIADEDEKNLQAWKKMIDATFSLNRAGKSTIWSSNGLHLHSLVDGSYETYFTTKGSDTTTMIEFDLNGQKSFDVLLLQENIRVGQRIEKFKLEYDSVSSHAVDNGGSKTISWVTIAEGTTVGYKRLIRFRRVTASRVRLHVEAARLNPVIAEFGLYQTPD